MDYFEVLHQQTQAERARVFAVLALLAKDGHLTEGGTISADAGIDPGPRLRDMLRSWGSMGASAAEPRALAESVFSDEGLAPTSVARARLYLEAALAEVLPPSPIEPVVCSLADPLAALSGRAAVPIGREGHFPSAPDGVNPFSFHVAWFYDFLVEHVHRVRPGTALSEGVRQFAEIEQGAPRKNVLGILQLRDLVRERLSVPELAPLEAYFEALIPQLTRDILLLKGELWAEDRERDQQRFSVLLQRVLSFPISPGDHLQLALVEQAVLAPGVVLQAGILIPDLERIARGIARRARTSEWNEANASAQRRDDSDNQRWRVFCEGWQQRLVPQALSQLTEIQRPELASALALHWVSRVPAASPELRGQMVAFLEQQSVLPKESLAGLAEAARSENGPLEVGERSRLSLRLNQSLGALPLGERFLFWLEHGSPAHGPATLWRSLIARLAKRLVGDPFATEAKT